MRWLVLLAAAAVLVLAPAAAPATPGSLAYADGDGNLYLATLQGTGAKTLFEADNSTSLVSLAVSDDGKEVLALDTGDVQRLVLVPTAGGQPDAVAGTDGADSGSFSPDGKSVIFSINEYSSSDLDPGLYTVALAGSATPKELVASPSGADDSMPQYSPDGTKLAFARDALDSHGEETVTLELEPASGGTPKALATGLVPDPVDGGSLSFSPDGATIAYPGDYGDPGIFTVPVAGGDPTQLTSDFDYWPAFSPDGSTLSFSRDSGSDNAADTTADDLYELWTVRKDGNGAALVSEGDFEGLAVYAGSAAGGGDAGTTTTTTTTTATATTTTTTATTATPAPTSAKARASKSATSAASAVRVTVHGTRYLVRWRGKAAHWRVTLRVGRTTDTARVKGSVHAHTFVLRHGKGAASAKVRAA